MSDGSLNPARLTPATPVRRGHGRYGDAVATSSGEVVFLNLVYFEV